MTGGTVSGNQFDPQLGVTTLGSTAEAVISVNTLRLEASNTFNVTAGTVSGGPDLLVTSSITQDVGPYGITKSGNGLMVIAGSNTYTGGTRVAGGLSDWEVPRRPWGRPGAPLTISGGTLDLHGYNLTVGVLGGASGAIDDLLASTPRR